MELVGKFDHLLFPQDTHFSPPPPNLDMLFFLYIVYRCCSGSIKPKNETKLQRLFAPKFTQKLADS